MSGSAGEERAAAALVAGQVALLAVIAIARRGTDWPRPRALRYLAVTGQLAGAVFSGLGIRALGDALTPSPLPLRTGSLRTDGPYAIVRHPVYAGLLLGAGSRTVGSGDRRAAVAFVALAALLHVKAGFEERRLVARYPEYRAYASRTPRLLPRPRH